jgi:hypothetical protein
VSITTDIDMSLALPVLHRERDAEEGGLSLVELLGGQEDLKEILSVDKALRFEGLHHLGDELSCHSSILGEAGSSVALLDSDVSNIDLLNRETEMVREPRGTC